MKIKEIIAQVRAKIEQVRSKLSDEEVAKLNSDLKSLESGVTDLQEDISRVNTESKERKLKIRDLESDISDKETEIDGLKKKADTSEITKEVEDLRTFKSNTIKGQRDSLAEKLTTVSKHPNFENVKNFFKLPDPDKDGKYDLSKMEDGDLEHNVNKLNEYEAAKMFGEVKKVKVAGEPRNPNPDGSGKPGDINSEDDLKSEIDKGFSELGD